MQNQNEKQLILYPDSWKLIWEPLMRQTLTYYWNTHREEIFATFKVGTEERLVSKATPRLGKTDFVGVGFLHEQFFCEPRYDYQRKK